ncbi:unnamed product [Ostreococcus tauri]|uniref:Unnamed product n=1 Tax=Ostreococcus tauri TaxID=70448 RepID=A0A096PAG3_OSTTA|nr:unnamed product [Ostreococcus tauri]CEG01903.1 unnamed product [Ostreococcus tauri]|eukprot:XP_022841237.1 unnamed product [Ostreococcus tauri]
MACCAGEERTMNDAVGLSARVVKPRRLFRKNILYLCPCSHTPPNTYSEQYRMKSVTCK